MKSTECFNTHTGVNSKESFLHTVRDKFQFCNTYHLAANDNITANVSLWLVDEPVDKITEAKPIHDTVQYRNIPSPPDQEKGYVQSSENFGCKLQDKQCYVYIKVIYLIFTSQTTI